MDNSSQLNNLYELARNAGNRLDSLGDAANYYEQILQIDPNSIEAYFYSNYYKYFNEAKVPLVGDAAGSIGDLLFNTFKMLREYLKQNHLTDNQFLVEVRVYCVKAELAAEMLADVAYKYYCKNSSVIGQYETLLRNYVQCVFLIRKAANFVKITDKELALEWLKQALVMCSPYERLNDLRQKVIEDIQEIEPNYIPPAPPIQQTQQNNGGCYVATAVYGSYDCPEVWTLRRYRDYDLSKTWYGRLFIHVYYAFSPLIVKCFGHTSWFKKIWKGKLDKMVKNLQEKGYESTPYEDINWN